VEIQRRATADAADVREALRLGVAERGEREVVGDGPCHRWCGVKVLEMGYLGELAYI
jgi:hypothetical protein